MLKKRCLSILLSLSLVLGLAAPSFAAEVETMQREAMIASEIEQKKQEIFSEVYRQLEEQDGLGMMEYYADILGARIEAQTYAKYGQQYSPMSTNAHGEIENARGGLLTYVHKSGLVEVSESYMDKTATDEYIKGYNKTSSIINTIMNIGVSVGMEEVASYLQAKHTAVVVVALIYMIQSARAIPTERIEKCGGCAYVMNMYNPTENYKTSVVLAWETVPYITIETEGLRDIQITLYPIEELS